MKRAVPVLLALALALASAFPLAALADEDPPTCPDTHYPCGGKICCSR